MMWLEICLYNDPRKYASKLRGFLFTSSTNTVGPDCVSSQRKEKRQICVDDCILLLTHLSNNMHFITNSSDPRQRVPLKVVDTIGNCQRIAFTVGVSQHLHTITNL